MHNLRSFISSTGFPMPLMLVGHDYRTIFATKASPILQSENIRPWFFKRLDERALQNLSRGELGFNLSRK